MSLNQELITDLRELEIKIESEGFDIVSSYKFGVMVGYANSDAVANLKKFKEVKTVTRF